MILKQSRLVVILWTFFKVSHVVQINLWLKSAGIERSIFQVIQAQGLIWLIGIGAIFSINYFVRTYDWFLSWNIKAILLNLTIMLFFGFLIPIGPAVAHVLWSDTSTSHHDFVVMYVSGISDIMPDVALYYLLLLSVSYGIHFYHEKNASALNSVKLKEDLLQAKLDLLQRQLQPHFLFNTLHNISSLMEENVKDAQNTLVDLSDLLRKSLEAQDAKFITLKEELEVLNLYLSIQMKRFSDSLSIEIEADESVLNEQVPSFILQPLVENSIMHGMQDKLTISIKAKKHNDLLYVIVEDDGPGFSELKEGIGIENVRSRLAALYTDATVAIQSENGVINEIVIPIEKQ